MCPALAELTPSVIGVSSIHAADETGTRNVRPASHLAQGHYMASEQAISFNYDAGLEVVTKDDQKLALLSSGLTRSVFRPAS